MQFAVHCLNPRLGSSSSEWRLRGNMLKNWRKNTECATQWDKSRGGNSENDTARQLLFDGAIWSYVEMKLRKEKPGFQNLACDVGWFGESAMNHKEQWNAGLSMIEEFEFEWRGEGSMWDVWTKKRWCAMGGRWMVDGWNWGYFTDASRKKHDRQREGCRCLVWD